MSGEKPLQALFDQALELDGDARAAWLAELRTRAPQMATRIERMLSLDAERVDPFAHAIASLKRSFDFDVDAWIGREMGGFRILRLLGEGGMGAVFLAERSSPEFQQLVALKLLRGRWLEASALKHFAGERKILARLRHPNIASMIDAGASDDGRPFLVMEYIEGTPLLDYCDAKRLNVSARLLLARGLLAALDYAHRSLVVHRDLKPANVLVTDDGIPKLLDFGIARMLQDEASISATATRAFTPDYASPEQLAGEPVGTGSDIYALGLVLYELCVGVLPWADRARPTSNAQPTPPSVRWQHLGNARCAELAARRGSDSKHLARSLRGDLGRVFARALAPEPSQRYASVHALDIDIAALLERRPPPGVQVPPLERALAFSRRHAWPLALATLILLAGVGALVQAKRSEHRLAAERDRAVAAAKRATVEAAKSKQIAGFVQNMLAGVDPARAHGMDRSLMRLILDTAAKRAQRELSDQPEVRMAIERAIALSYDAIGDDKAALTHYDAALDAAQQSHAPQEQSISLETRKASSLSDLGEFKQAMAFGHKVVKQAAMLPTDSRPRLYAESTLASFYCDAGQFVECRKRLLRIVALQRKALGASDPNTTQSISELAFAQSNLAQFDKAQALYTSLVTRFRKRYGAADPRTLFAIKGLAINELRAKHYPQAEALLKPAVALAKKTFGPNHPATIGMIANLGGAIRQQPGRNAEAKPYYAYVLKAYMARYGPDKQQTVFAQINLASLLRDAGELKAAEQHARIAVAHMDKALGAHNPYRGMLLDTLGMIQTREQRYTDAAATLARAWEILSHAAGFGPSHPAAQDVIRHEITLNDAADKPKLAATWRARLIPASGSSSGNP